MIKAILVFNNQGKPRLTRFFTHYVSLKTRKRDGKSVHLYFKSLRAVLDRRGATVYHTRSVSYGEQARRGRVQFPWRTDVSYTGCTRGGARSRDHEPVLTPCRSKLGEGEFRLIYRHYATLYFVFCVDSSESELGILDLIQVCDGLLVGLVMLVLSCLACSCLAC